MSKESMKLALEALESLQDWPGAFEKCVKAETALREALAEQPAQRKPLTDQQQAAHTIYDGKGNVVVHFDSKP